MRTCAVHLVTLALAACCVGVAQQSPSLPIDFDDGVAHWKARPTFQATPASEPHIAVRDGAATLSVDEPGRSMKFELPIRPFDSELHGYLVFRYRAENLAGGYAIWVYDGAPGGREILNTSRLTTDGQWHVAAIDLWAAGVVGAVRSLITDVRCAGEPASITFDRIWLAGEPPADAAVFPEQIPAPVTHELQFEKIGELTHQPGWLANPTEAFGSERTDTALVLRVNEPASGMKWSVDLAEPIELSQFAYVAIRYRARDIGPSGDYCVWLGSATGGQPPENTVPLRLSDLSDDGEWHVAVSVVDEQFAAVSVALQVQSGDDNGEVALDWIRFSGRKPMIAAEDMLAFGSGWDGARLPAGSFSTVDLSEHGNDTMAGHLRSQGFSSWLEPGRITVGGIPFELGREPAGILAAAPEIGGVGAVPVQDKATEVYLLIGARLPIEKLRRGGQRQIQKVTTVERFVCEVEYADGVTDQVFPVSLQNGSYELKHGIAAYALTDLRDAPLREVRLRNHMYSADIVAAAITLNRGEPATKAPDVQELPESRPIALVLPVKPAGIAESDDGFTIDSHLLRMDLRTENGISLRGLQLHRPGGEMLRIEPGPLFELGVGDTVLSSEQVTVGEASMDTENGVHTLTIPIDGRPGGVPIAGALVITVGIGEDIGMNLDISNVGDGPIVPVVNFPLVRGARIGSVEDTWYLYCRKGGIISNRPTRQSKYYGGEYPLQVSDIFNPKAGSGLALLTYDRANIYRTWELTKDADGVDWRMGYFGYEHQPGALIEVAPTALRAHWGDWRAALGIYRDWVRGWYKPQVPRKRWFQGVFYYQQVTAWSVLRDRATGQWRTAEVVKRFQNFFGRLDYLHIFDFGQSMVYGRVGDYNHYDELGGLDRMRAEIAAVQAMGIPVGLYIEGYLCDDRGVWGSGHVSGCDIRQADGTPLMWPGSDTEHMMCPACRDWREHLATTYGRVAKELQPNGMYIDQYGFINTWKVCHSSEHGHPTPWPPIRGERDTTEAIRAGIGNTEIANLTEETPNDVTSQHQDGALGYSVSANDPELAPHRVDLFRFIFPDFKVFQLTQYDSFTEGDWDLLKFPFFNGEGFWLHGGTEDYDPEAADFLRKAFAILNENEGAFCSDDVEALVPTLVPSVYANRFSGEDNTVWTLFNARYHSFRGDCLRVPHTQGTRYVNAFTDQLIAASVDGGRATIPIELSARGVGCVIAQKP